MEKLNKVDDTLIHIGHRHSLNLTDVPGGDTAPPYCHACRFPCTGSIYQCAPCRYILHRRAPGSPAPSATRRTRSTTLSIRFTPAGDCGYSWSFRCDPCAFDLHSPCAALPAAAVAPAHRHRHRLTLTYEDPMGSFDFCAVCRKGYSTARWFYTCRECGVGGHVGCVMPDMPLRDEYAALDKKQVAVANAATWPEGAVPESQQLEELLHEQGIQFARMELVPAGFCRCSPRLAKIDMLAVSLYPIQAGK